LKFRSKNESELRNLDDDELVDYMVKARDRGHDAEVRLAAWILVGGRYRQILALVRQKVRDYHDAEDITQTVIEQAVKARFDGIHTGQFFSMVVTIRKRRVADYLEKKARQPALESPEPDGSDPYSGLSTGDDFEAGVDLTLLCEDLLDECSERDRMVIQLRIQGHAAKEVAEAVSASGVDGSDGLTSLNCDTIYSRFRKKLRLTLEHDGRASA
jgi:RNA polymerase sigma factor (sigma-70 family)